MILLCLIHELLVLTIGMSYEYQIKYCAPLSSKLAYIFRNDYENFVREFSRHLVHESERVDTYMASTIQVLFSQGSNHHNCLHI